MLELDTEAVVIGSGFSGSVVASRLVEQGVSVIMLERGPWRDTVPVESMNIRDHAQLPVKSFGKAISNSVMAVCHHRFPWARGIGINRNSGTFEAHFHNGFISVASSQVGGGSLIYGGMIDRPLAPDFWDDVADGISEEILAPHFERVKSELGTISVNAAKLGFPNYLPQVMQQNSAFDLTKNTNVMLAHKLAGEQEHEQTEYGIERKDSILRESLSFGCLNGSKASTDAVYLGPALAKGLKLLAHCEVDSVRKKASGGYCILATHRVHKKSIKIHCNKLFMAAGVYNTVRLLLEAQRDGGLHPMPCLGKGIGNNGDDLAILLNAATGDSDAERSGLVTAFTMPEVNPNNLHIVANLDVPAPRSRWLRFLLRPLLKGALVAGMGRDLANGVATLHKKQLKIDYDPRKQETNRTVSEGNGATIKAFGLKSIRFGKPITAHPFGGAIVSQSETDGVVNGVGECHQNANLYVIDGAAIPKAPGRPPTLNISAWASHVADKVVSNCSKNTAIDIHLDFEQILKQPNDKELAVAFSCLPSVKVGETQPLFDTCTLNSLVANGFFNSSFKRLFDEKLTLILAQADVSLDYLKPQSRTLNQPKITNSWDGSGLVYQISTEVKGEQVDMQLRKIPHQEAWLVRSASERKYLGWHLLIP